jgi:hypothetical protein
MKRAPGSLTKMFKFFLLFVCLGAAEPAAHAENPPAPAFSVRFRTLGWKTNIPENTLFYHVKDTEKSISVMSDSRSLFYDYRGPSEITFYQNIPGADGTPRPTAVCSAELKDAGDWPLLIFSKEAGTPEKFKIRVIPDDLQAFPPGSFRFVNYTTLQPTAKVGSKSVTLAPDEITTIKEQPSGDNRTLFVSVLQPGSKTQPILYSNNWAYYPGQRTMVFIVPESNRTGYCQVQRMTEATDFLETPLLPPPTEKNEKSTTVPVP